MKCTRKYGLKKQSPGIPEEPGYRGFNLKPGISLNHCSNYECYNGHKLQQNIE